VPPIRTVLLPKLAGIAGPKFGGEGGEPIAVVIQSVSDQRPPSDTPA